MEFFALMFGLGLGLFTGWVLGASLKERQAHPLIFNERKYDRIVSDMERITERTKNLARR